MSAPPVRTPRDVADLRIWLRNEWRPGGAWHDYARLIVERENADRHAPGLRPQNPDNYARWDRDTLTAASLWWVGEEMVDVLTAAMPSVPGEVRPDDLLPPPGAAGFCVFAKPIVGLDAETEGKTVTIDAIAWARCQLGPTSRFPRGKDALSVSFYRCLDFDDGLAGDEIALAAGAGAFQHAIVDPAVAYPVNDPMIDRGETVTIDMIERNMAEHGYEPGTRAKVTQRHHRLHGSTWVPIGRSDWPIGDSLVTEPWPMPATELASAMEDRRLIAALWSLLLTDGVTARTVERADRPTGRRTQREGMTRELADVQVVTLRRPRHAPPDDHEPGAHREYSHRWIVRPHYRLQPYGPGRTQRRLILIGPYVKGPEDKPLKTPTRVTAWVR